MKKIVTFVKSIWFCLRLSWQASKLYTLIRLLVRSVVPMIPVISSFASKRIIDALTLQASDGLGQVVGFILLISIGAILAIVLEKAVQYCEIMHSEILSRFLSMQMMEIALTADLEVYDNREFYDKFTALRQDSYSTTLMLWNTIDCIGTIVSLTVIVITISLQNVWYGVLLAIAYIPSAILTNRYTKALYHMDLEQIQNERKKNYIDAIAFSKNYAQEIRLFDLSSFLKEKYHCIWKQIFEKKQKILHRKTLGIIAITILPEILTLIILFDIVNKIFSSLLTPGDFTLYSSLFSQMSVGIMTLIMRISNIYENKMKIDNMSTFQQFLIRNIKSGDLSVESEIETIEFKNVWFKYPFSDDYVLRDISFKILRGQKIGIVGINGAGKSTIIKLLTRLYDVTKGEILINGKNIKEYKVKDLRKQFSCYFQNASNYAFTLKENIGMVSDSSNEESIINCLHSAGIDNVYEMFPDGLETYITRMFSQNGVELSEGQHQKVALSRAFHRNASVFVLDEPSSSLDPEAEFLLFEQMKEFLDNKTVIFTSHRLSTIHLAEYILVIENGRLIESGTKKELLANPKRFAELYDYQMSRFVEKDDCDN